MLKKKSYSFVVEPVKMLAGQIKTRNSFRLNPYCICTFCFCKLKDKNNHFNEKSKVKFHEKYKYFYQI